MDAFRILERTRNPGRTIIVLTDGQRFAWRPGESGRWALVRDLHRRLPFPPVVWSIAFGGAESSETSNASIGPLSMTRTMVTPGLPLTVTTSVENAGNAPITRTAELLVDGRPVAGSAQVAGPIPAGGRTPLSFATHDQRTRLPPADRPARWRRCAARRRRVGYPDRGRSGDPRAPGRRRAESAAVER